MCSMTGCTAMRRTRTTSECVLAAGPMGRTAGGDWLGGRKKSLLSNVVLSDFNARAWIRLPAGTLGWPLQSLLYAATRPPPSARRAHSPSPSPCARVRVAAMCSTVHSAAHQQLVSAAASGYVSHLIIPTDAPNAEPPAAHGGTPPTRKTAMHPLYWRPPAQSVVHLTVRDQHRTTHGTP